MLLQTNSYIVPKERRAEHARLLRRFRQVLLRLGCEQFEVYEQMGANWSSGDAGGRFVQIMKFRDRKHQRQIHAAEQTDPAAQQLIAEFCDLINLPYQQQQGLLAIGYYTGVVEMTPGAAGRRDAAAAAEAGTAEAGEADEMGMQELPPARGGFGSPLGGAAGLTAAAAAGAFGVAADSPSTGRPTARGEQPQAADDDEDDADADRVAGTQAEEFEAATADEELGEAEDELATDADAVAEPPDAGWEAQAEADESPLPPEAFAAAAVPPLPVATGGAAGTTRAGTVDARTPEDVATARVGGGSVPELSPAGEVELDEEFESGEDVPFAGEAVTSDVAGGESDIPTDELESLLAEAEARADLPAGPTPTDTAAEAGPGAGLTLTDLQVAAPAEGDADGPAGDASPPVPVAAGGPLAPRPLAADDEDADETADGEAGQVEDAFDDLFEEVTADPPATAPQDAIGQNRGGGGGGGGGAPEPRAEAAIPTADAGPAQDAIEVAAPVADQGGLLRHLSADEGEIEILFEAPPEVSSNGWDAGEDGEHGGNNEIDAALNEALRD